MKSLPKVNLSNSSSSSRVVSTHILYGGTLFLAETHSQVTARVAAGLPDLRIHDLRHSFCSSAVAAGVDLYTVGKIAGHKDYKSTQRYAHLADDTLKKAVEKSAANLNVDWANAGGAGHGL